LLAGAEGEAVSGFEIHMGATSGTARPAFYIGKERRPEGAVSEDGMVVGTYLHGLFENDAVRGRVVANLRGADAVQTARWDPESHIDRLARHASQCLDIGRIREIAGL
jgi:adenosylcobyric acid synthase